MDECLAQGVEPSALLSDWNPLLRAVFLGRLRLTRLLLEGGAYVNESNDLGHTPLMVAITTTHRDHQSCPRHRMVRYLLECGADPNIQDKSGKTSLVHAVLAGVEPQTLSLLVGSGADPALPDHLGSSALVYAIRSGNSDALRLLVDTCRAAGKQVIIINTGLKCEQFSSAPPPPPLDLCSHFCSFDGQRRSPPQGASASTTSQPGSPLLGARGTADFVAVAPPLQHSVSVDNTMRRPFCRRHSVDVRDSDSLLRTLQTLPAGQAPRKMTLGRKMSYDSATNTTHSASHPNLHQETHPPKLDEDSCVSSLKNVICLRRFQHYNSDSQLPQFATVKNCAAVVQERRKPGAASLHEPGKNRGLFERRGSGALLLDHIAHTRPGFLPPLNPHAPIPHIGISSGASSCISTSVSSAVSSSVSLCVSSSLSSCSRQSSLTSSKPLLPCAPSFPKDFNIKKTLWRRHSMQSEQIKELSNFEESFGC